MVIKDHRDLSFLGCLGTFLAVFSWALIHLHSALASSWLTILGTFFGWGVFLHLDFNLLKVPPPLAFLSMANSAHILSALRVGKSANVSCGLGSGTWQSPYESQPEASAVTLWLKCLQNIMGLSSDSQNPCECKVDCGGSSAVPATEGRTGDPQSKLTA